MNIKLAPPQLMDLKPRITVIGIGGAGCNAINNMIATHLDGVEFVVANTDAQSLSMSNAERRIQLGSNLTEGLGAGARPEVGEAAAREAEEDIKAEIAGSHMVFIAAGMGGGTGTGAAAVIAEIARDLGILTVGIVSKPFQFEGARRMRTADAGIEMLEKVVDTLIVIPNQNLFRIANERTTFAEAFRLADQVLYSGIACIVDLIVKEGLINLDFADVQAVMKGMGSAMMGTGEATGEDRALTAANEAIANPLLDNISLSGAQGLLISIVGGSDLTLYEVDTAASHIRKEVAADANIIVGATTEEGMDDRIRVSIVASGMSATAAGAQPSSSAYAIPATPAVPLPTAPEPSAGNKPKKFASNIGTDSQQDQAGPVSETAVLSQDELPKTPPALSEADQLAEMDADEADEFARALSEAMEGARPEDDEMGAWQSADGVFVEDGFANLSGESEPMMPPPSLPEPDAPSPELGQQAVTQRGGRNQRHEPAPTSAFEPAPPAAVRRSSRRMPDVSDFPEIAQREYFAKMDEVAAPIPDMSEDRGYEQPAPRRHQEGQSRRNEEPRQRSNKRPQPTTEPVRSRPGLLSRLTGSGRR